MDNMNNWWWVWHTLTVLHHEPLNKTSLNVLLYPRIALLYLIAWSYYLSQSLRFLGVLSSATQLDKKILALKSGPRWGGKSGYGHLFDALSFSASFDAVMPLFAFFFTRRWRTKFKLTPSGCCLDKKKTTKTCFSISHSLTFLWGKP